MCVCVCVFVCTVNTSTNILIKWQTSSINLCQHFVTPSKWHATGTFAVCVCVCVFDTCTGSSKNNITVSNVYNEVSRELTMTKYLSTVG